jgi:hypothetical protein
MAVCPFYRLEAASIEGRKQLRAGGPETDTKRPAPWCAHLYSPVSRFTAMRVVGEPDRLRCGGQIECCQIASKRRPTL